MENLGPIAVSYGYADTVSELAVMLPVMLESIPIGTVDLDRVVLIIPRKLAVRLGWSGAGAPRVMIWLHDLVFQPPASV